MRSPLSKGLKLTLFPICGLGLIYIVLIIHILFWISSHGWGVGRVFGLVFLFVFVLFPFVHDPCTLGFFFFLYNICFLLIKKKKLKSLDFFFVFDR